MLSQFLFRILLVVFIFISNQLLIGRVELIHIVYEPKVNAVLG
jgi:hypothetical protein